MEIIQQTMCVFIQTHNSEENKQAKERKTNDGIYTSMRL